MQVFEDARSYSWYASHELYLLQYHRDGNREAHDRRINYDGKQKYKSLSGKIHGRDPFVNRKP